MLQISQDSINQFLKSKSSGNNFTHSIRYTKQNTKEPYFEKTIFNKNNEIISPRLKLSYENRLKTSNNVISNNKYFKKYNQSIKKVEKRIDRNSEYFPRFILTERGFKEITGKKSDSDKELYRRSEENSLKRANSGYYDTYETEEQKYHYRNRSKYNLEKQNLIKKSPSQPYHFINELYINSNINKGVKYSLRKKNNNNEDNKQNNNININNLSWDYNKINYRKIRNNINNYKSSNLLTKESEVSSDKNKNKYHLSLKYIRDSDKNNSTIKINHKYNINPIKKIAIEDIRKQYKKENNVIDTYRSKSIILTSKYKNETEPILDSKRILKNKNHHILYESVNLSRENSKQKLETDFITNKGKEEKIRSFNTDSVNFNNSMKIRRVNNINKISIDEQKVIINNNIIRNNYIINQNNNNINNIKKINFIYRDKKSPKINAGIKVISSKEIKNDIKVKKINFVKVNNQAIIKKEKSDKIIKEKIKDKNKNLIENNINKNLSVSDIGKVKVIKKKKSLKAIKNKKHNILEITKTSEITFEGKKKNKINKISQNNTSNSNIIIIINNSAKKEETPKIEISPKNIQNKDENIILQNENKQDQDKIDSILDTVKQEIKNNIFKNMNINKKLINEKPKNKKIKRKALKNVQNINKQPKNNHINKSFNENNIKDKEINKINNDKEDTIKSISRINVGNDINIKDNKDKNSELNKKEIIINDDNKKNIKKNLNNENLNSIVKEKEKPDKIILNKENKSNKDEKILNNQNFKNNQNNINIETENKKNLTNIKINESNLIPEESKETHQIPEVLSHTIQDSDDFPKDTIVSNPQENTTPQEKINPQIPAILNSEIPKDSDESISNNMNISNKETEEQKNLNNNDNENKNKDEINKDVNNNEEEIKELKPVIQHHIERKRPVFTLPSDKKRSTSEDKPFHLIQKYYNENFILEDDEEEKFKMYIKNNGDSRNDSKENSRKNSKNNLLININDNSKNIDVNINEDSLDIDNKDNVNNINGE